CFVGNNGVGKTNVLDAIYHLSFGKSYFNPVTTQNIKHGADFFMIEGLFEKNERQENIICSAKKGQKKVIKRNNKAYEKISEHVGLLPVVIISPADRDLIAEGSETRRKFIDGIIAQSNKTYLMQLIDYNKILMQRNSLLKYFALNNVFNLETLAVYNTQLHSLGTAIFKERAAFIEAFVPIFKAQYGSIVIKEEHVNITYKSQLFDNELKILLETHLNNDKALQYTSVGTHKDDLSFEMSTYPIKKFGSQGQQKSFLIALKLAQFHFIKAQTGVTPVLLLDDIFDKLDESRVAQVVQLVDREDFGQIFISDTHADRTEIVVKETQQSYELFRL
ncbi:MAG: DNA replication and repair protein RecF, partial [Bacteroidota bacterium]